MECTSLFEDNVIYGATNYSIWSIKLYVFNDSVYYNCKKIKLVDWFSFEFIAYENSYLYYRDNNNIYFNNKPINADTNSFKLLRNWMGVYSRDESNLFMLWKVVDWFDIDLIEFDSIQSIMRNELIEEYDLIVVNEWLWLIAHKSFWIKQTVKAVMLIILLIVILLKLKNIILEKYNNYKPDNLN